MKKLKSFFLRFGPLIAAGLLGLQSVLEPIFPGYTGVVSGMLSVLGLVGAGPNMEAVELFTAGAAGATALLGVGRKLLRLASKP